MAPLTFTPSDPLREFVLPMPTPRDSGNPEVRVPTSSMLTPGNKTSSLNLKLWLPPRHVLVVPAHHQSKKGTAVLPGVTGPYREVVGLRPHAAGREEYVYHWSVPSYSHAKFNCK